MATKVLVSTGRLMSSPRPGTTGKRVNYAALQALGEALATAWWYRQDFERFVRTYVPHPEVLARVSFGGTNREASTGLLSLLGSDEGYTGTVIDLMAELCALDESFPHLRRLEDGEAKAEAARASVQTLRGYYESYAGVIADREAAAQRREEARTNAAAQRATSDALQELKNRYTEVLRLPAQQRGYALQGLLHDLFVMFDLDPKASFAISGEQIDGAFSFENDDYLFEARWQDSPADPAALRDFAGKIDTKLKTTLGVFVSMSGYTDAAVSNHSHKGATMILVDGEDLYSILDARVSLPNALLRKRRHASQTGNIYLRVRDF